MPTGAAPQRMSRHTPFPILGPSPRSVRDLEPTAASASADQPPKENIPMMGKVEEKGCPTS
eukprot:scaffold16154_cov122-Isochrysis_galbana.AAC.3